MFDYIIRNATVIDGRRRENADVGITGKYISAVGDLSRSRAGKTLDARGKILSPGFTDTHTHMDGWLLKEPYMLPKVSQGITTEIVMGDGISYAPMPQNLDKAKELVLYQEALNALDESEYTEWHTLSEYATRVEGRNVQNFACLIPYSNLRVAAVGYSPGKPTRIELESMLDLARQGMADGAVGFSTGLEYLAQYHGSTDEIVELCKEIGRHGGVYVTHMRYQLGTLPALAEAVEIGKRAGIPVHVSHLKGTDEAESQAILDYIDRVAVNEVEFSFDIYPYLPGSTMLSYLFPEHIWNDGPREALRKLRGGEFRSEIENAFDQVDLESLLVARVVSSDGQRFEGLNLLQCMELVGAPSIYELVAQWMREEGLGVLLLFLESRFHDESINYPLLIHDRCSLGSDGIFHEESPVHPRVYGSFPKVLGRYVREQKLLSLEEAVRKLSSLPCEIFGLEKRGYIDEGNYADLVMFDPDKIIDHATFDNPHQVSSGVSEVFVNGTLILENEEMVDPSSYSLPGCFLKLR